MFFRTTVLVLLGSVLSCTYAMFFGTSAFDRSAGILVNHIPGSPFVHSQILLSVDELVALPYLLLAAFWIRSLWLKYTDALFRQQGG